MYELRKASANVCECVRGCEINSLYKYNDKIYAIAL